MAKVYWHYVEVVERLVRFGFRVEALGVTIPGVSPPSEQLDVVQETFAKAFTEKARVAYNGISTYRPYLLRISKNLLIDRGRKRQRDIPSDIDHLSLDNAESEETLDNDPEWQRLSIASRDFIAQLSTADREFVALRFEREMSQAAVAEKFGWTRRRVRTTEENVRKRLLVFLAQKGLQ